MSVLGYFLKIIIMILSNMFSVPRVSQVRCHLQGCLKGFSHIVFTELSDRPFLGEGDFFQCCQIGRIAPFYTFFIFLNLKCLCKFEEKKIHVYVNKIVFLL